MWIWSVEEWGENGSVRRWSSVSQPHPNAVPLVFSSRGLARDHFCEWIEERYYGDRTDAARIAQDAIRGDMVSFDVIGYGGTTLVVKFYEVYRNAPVEGVHFFSK